MSAPSLAAMSSFETRLALRGRAVLGGALAFAAAAGVVAFVGLSTFRQVGMGTLTGAATALLEVGLLVPTLVAITAAGAALHGDGERALRAMLRAAGVGTGAILLAKLTALLGAAAVVVGSGVAAAALVLAGALRPADLPAFAFIAVVALMASAAACSIGLLVSAAARDRAQALVTSVAAWVVLAVGVDLAVILVAPALRGGATLVVAAALDPLEAARLAGLIALGADGHVLGGLGAYVLVTLGPERAVLILLSAVAAWVVVPFALAWALARREDLP